MLVLQLNKYHLEDDGPYIELIVPPSNDTTRVRVMYCGRNEQNKPKLGFEAPRKVAIVRSDAVKKT